MKNQVQLIGRVGKEPMRNGSVTSFNLATTEKYKDKNGEWKEVTDWHNISCFGQLADFAQKHISKGQLLSIDGKIKYSEKDGKYYTNIVAINILFLSKKTNNSDDDLPF